MQKVENQKIGAHCILSCIYFLLLPTTIAVNSAGNSILKLATIPIGLYFVVTMILSNRKLQINGVHLALLVYTFSAISALFLNASAESILKTMRLLLLVYVMGLSLVPVVSCLINPVYYVWGFIYVSVDSIFKKHHRHIFLVLLPLLLQLINVLLGPAVFNHPRYFYPVYWSLPFILVFAYRNKLANSRCTNAIPNELVIHEERSSQ